MQPILESLAKHLVNTGGAGSGETRIILPNRRAGLFLQRHLARMSPDVRWSPRIYAISDFINEFSHIDACDPVEAVFTLHEVYQKVKEQPDPLDEFFYWGEIMIHDFDELDKYLVDAGMLFRNIADLKEIEEPLAGLDDPQISFISQFWEGFHEGRVTPEKDQFLEMWKLLPILYRELRSELLDRREGYPGMQYREIAERIEQNEMESPGDTRTIVAGFNALNGCEKRIFNWLRQHGATFFWDFDHHYTADASSEAGRFMRDNLLRFPPEVELESFRGIESEKEIRIFELPTDILQAKTVFRILEQKDHAAIADCTDTAVVLCDEELLMPVLMSVPGSIEEINVTMGYPMKNTPVSSFVESLQRLQNNIRQGTDGTEQFYYKDVRSILLHPYMEKTGEGAGHPLLEEMATGNLIQVEKTFFKSEFEKKIFRRVEDAADLIRYQRTVFLHILENLAVEEEKMMPELHREFVFLLLIHLNKLETLLASRPDIPLPVLERLFRKVVSGLRVPFEGEPLSGLQVMGILETRLLDFKHVILLSMNEEVMPASHFGQSYIPYALRVAFGMPAREDMDAIYAYYFNRLLQRAEKIDLLFNSTSEGVRTGEMSRYLHQLIYNRGINVIRPGMEVMARETAAVVVQHTSDVDQKLRIYAVDDANGKYLSPSAINTYIDCSLKFYLRYLAGIKEPDEIQEEIDAAGFGTVVHDSIHLLYGEISEKRKGEIGRDDLARLLASDRIEEVLTGVFLRYHYKGRKNATIEGRNIIILQVMTRYLKKIIETDLQITPFALIAAEQTYSRILEIGSGGDHMEIRLGGKIDRVDRLGEAIRVIDYKTGEANQGFSGIEALFDASLASRNGAALQTLFYAWLVTADHPGEQVTPGLYVMKALYDHSFDPGLSMGRTRQRKKIESFAELEEEFVGHLKEAIAAIFNPEIPYVQTENESKCRYCDFAGICNRNFIE